MSSKHRVFSHEKNNHYSDYLKIKQSERLLNQVKNIQGASLSHFTSYQDYLNSIKACGKSKNNHLCSLHPLMNMYQTNSSFITYEKIIQPKNQCELLKDNLYPYGTYVSNAITPI
jgi:hypothetical protein